ncbi:MAG: hypothetical protein LBU17_06870 [Treponema sp.]|nr:hypothetical protein [Treponema sp.]
MNSVKLTLMFIVFNIVILFFLIALGFFSFHTLGFDFAGTFWRSSWPIILGMLAVLGALDIYWAMNRRLLVLLQQEDWPALTHYLETRIIQEGHYSSRLIRLLAQTYLAHSNSAALIDLEHHIIEKKPRLLETHALVLGLARLLHKDISGGVQFFSARLNVLRAKSARQEFARGDPSWIHWYYGFTLLLEQQFPLSAEQLMCLARKSHEALVAGLAAFYLTDTLCKVLPEQSTELYAAALEGRRRVRKSLHTLGAWDKAVLKIQAEIYGIIMLQALQNAGHWIYEEQAPQEKS